MSIAVILTVVLTCILLLYCFKSKRGIDPNIPEYPGKLPLIGHLHLALGGGVSIYKMIQKFGKYAFDNGSSYMSVSLGPLVMIVVMDPDGAFAILQSNPEKLYIYSFMKPLFGEGLVTADYKTWLRHKRLIYPMFAQQHINNFIGIFNKQARRLVERFAVHVGRGDFNHELDLVITGLETVCQTALGSDVGEQLTRNTEYVKTVTRIFDIAVTRFIYVWYHLESLYSWSSLKRNQDKCERVIKKLSEELVKKKRVQLTDPHLKNDDNKDKTKPFIDHLLKVEAENADFNDTEISDQINTIIVAGYDSTATGLVYTLMLLGHHKDVQQKVYDEIEEVFGGSDRDVDKEDYPKLIYLDAVIKETLRLYPIVPSVARTVTKDVKIGNIEVKAGSHCAISIFSINRHPEWGPDADEFRPERWLDGTLPKNPNLRASFSIGRRFCIGKAYGIMAIKTSITHIVRRYKVSSDVSKLVLKMEVLTKPASGQHISLEERKMRPENIY